MWLKKKSLKENIFHYNTYLIVHCNSYYNLLKMYVCICFALFPVMKNHNTAVNVGVLTMSSNVLVTVWLACNILWVMLLLCLFQYYIII